MSWPRAATRVHASASAGARGHVCGSEFADRVAHQVVRLHAPVPQERGHRHLDREQGGLGEPGLVDQARVIAEHHVLDGCGQIRVQARTRFFEGVGVGREGGVSSRPMPSRWLPWPENMKPVL